MTDLGNTFAEINRVTECNLAELPLVGDQGTPSEKVHLKLRHERQKGGEHVTVKVESIPGRVKACTKALRQKGV